MGTALITDDEEGPPSPWPVESTKPDFFVVDDWYSDKQQYHYVEVETPSRLNLAVLAALKALVDRRVGWGVGIGVPKDLYVYMEARGTWTTGESLRGCRTIAEVAECCQALGSPSEE